MEYRTLGRAGVKVSPLCLGTMMFGGPTNERDSIRIIHRAMAAGINFMDTANVYNDGESERVIGKAVRANREKWVIATKVHGSMGDDVNAAGSHRFHIMSAVEASLERLGTDHIDIYYLHLLQTELREESYEVAQKLGPLAEAHGKTLTQFSLAWVLANPVITSVIIGPRTMAQLEDNLGCLDCKLTESDEKAIDQLVPPGEHTGKGYNDPAYPVLGRFRAE